MKKLGLKQLSKESLKLIKGGDEVNSLITNIYENEDTNKPWCLFSCKPGCKSGCAPGCNNSNACAEIKTN